MTIRRFFAVLVLTACAAGTSFAQANLPTSYTGPWFGATPPTGWTFTGLGTPDYADYDGGGGGAARFDTSGDMITIFFSGTPSNVAYWIKGNSVSGAYVFKVEESADSTNWTDAAAYEGAGITGSAVPHTNALQDSSRYLRFHYVTKAAGNVGVDGITINGSGGTPMTNVKFTASAAAVNENAGTCEITVIKTLSEGDVGGDIVLSGTATEGVGGDYTINATNFTLNGATTSATFTVTINDDSEQEASETVVLTLANVTGGTIVSPSVFTLTINASDAGEPPVWINEINYDPPGTDAGEYLEVAGPAAVDLSNYILVLYNGANGQSYGTLNLTGAIDDEGCGYGALAFDYSGIQQGPDGVAVAQVGGGVTTLVQFLSYEGVFTASNGPAAGVGSVNIGAQNNTNITLQLGGTASNYSGFVWETNAASQGSLNVNQTIPDCTGTPPTYVKFTIAADSVTEDVGTYDITVFKTAPEGTVSGEIVISGTASWLDFAISATNFTLDGATTSATFIVTITDDEELEPAETIIMTLANVTGGTIGTPSALTLTIRANDTPPEGILEFRFADAPFLQVTRKDAHIGVSDMALSSGTIETGVATGDYFPNEPYIEESGGWTAGSQAAAKAFRFTITPDSGYSVTVTGIAFRAYATVAGPSALSYDIGSGLKLFNVDFPSNTLMVISQEVDGVSDQVAPILVQIQGWTNGSRPTAGSGAFRLDDVVIYGVVSGGGTPSQPSVTVFTVQPGSSASATINSTLGKTYLLQYTEGLNADPVVWTTVDTEAGTGGVIVLEDTTVSGVIRLYRVVEE